MDSFNKIISFVLGLIVVIVFLAVITGRFNLASRLKGGGQAKISPPPTVAAKQYISPTTTMPGETGKATNRYSTTPKTPPTIPATGSPTMLLPFLFSSLSAGLYLRKRGKRD